MTTAVDGIPYLERVRSQLVAAHPVARRRARRQRVVALASVLVALVVGIGALGVLGSEPASAAVVVTEEHGTVVVRIASERAPRQEIVDALADAGLAARVEAVPAGPSAVGRFVGLYSPEATARLDQQVGSAFSVARFSAASADQAVLKVGRVAADGEVYARAVDAFLPGEPLACLKLRGVAASATAAVVAERGLAATWLDSTGNQIATPPAGTYVISATSSAPKAVSIRLTTSPTSSPQPSGCRE